MLPPSERGQRGRPPLIRNLFIDYLRHVPVVETIATGRLIATMQEQ